MKYFEMKGDIFKQDISNRYIVHCISSDLELGAGIAKLINKKYNMRDKLLQFPAQRRYFQQVIIVDNVVNLITKENYYDKPVYRSLKVCLLEMRRICLAYNIRSFIMPKIGTNLDKLDWDIVKGYIHQVFEHTDFNIIICDKKM